MPGPGISSGNCPEEKRDWLAEEILNNNGKQLSALSTTHAREMVQQLRAQVEELKRSKRLNDALASISAAISSTPFEAAAQQVLEAANKALDTEIAVLHLRWRDKWQAITTSDFPHELTNTAFDEATLSAAGLALSCGDLIAVADTGTDTRAIARPLRDYGVRSVLIVPLHTRERLLGIVHFIQLSRSRAFDDTQQGFAKRFSATLALALENEHLLRQIEESEPRYYNLFHNSNVVLLLIDPETGDIVDANPSAVAFYGYSVEELKRKKISQINTLPPDQVKKEMDRARSKQRKQFYFQHRLASGEIRDVEVYSEPILIGEQQLLYSIIHDVTESKRAEKELAQSRQVLARTFASLREAIFIVDDTSMRIIDCNPAAEEMFGYSREEMIGEKRILVHVNKETFTTFMNLLHTAVENQGYLSLPEFQMKRKNGEIFDTEHTVLPLEDENGRRLGWVSVVRDITERKKLEQMKSEFIANVTHELRAPLSLIMAYTETLLEDAASRPSSEPSPILGEFLRTIYESGQRLQWLVEDLLDAASMESGRFRMDFKIVQLAALIRSVVSSALPSATMKGITLEYADAGSDLPVVKGDARRLEQAITNLLNNAIKFTPRGGSVSVTTGYDDAGVIIQVSDTGIGIPEDDIEHIFDRFHRGLNVSGEYSSGVGLGLYITKTIVESHRGKIEVSSEPGKGSTFRIRLPVE